MKNIVLKTCLTALAFSVAGLANAQDAGEPVKIFTEQLTSHAAISAAAISISADSFVDGHIASQAAVTTGAGSEVQNIVSGAATGIGAAAKTCDIYAGAAIAVGAGSTVGALTAGGAVTLGALADRDVICDPAPAVVTSDFDAANAQIKSAQSALDTIPASSLVDAYTLVGSMDTGVYEGAAITIPANTLITFDANGQDGIWIFNLSGAMSVGAGSEFEIINAGDNNAVIWNIGGALTLGAGSTFLGTAFVEGAVSGATASVSCGNLYATGAISIGSIVSDNCEVSADQLAAFGIGEGEFSFGNVYPGAVTDDSGDLVCPVWGGQSGWINAITAYWNNEYVTQGSSDVIHHIIFDEVNTYEAKYWITYNKGYWLEYQVLNVVGDDRFTSRTFHHDQHITDGWIIWTNEPEVGFTDWEYYDFFFGGVQSQENYGTGFEVVSDACDTDFNTMFSLLR
jgi:hypothetical protein